MPQRSRDWNLLGIPFNVHAGWLGVLALLSWTAAIHFREHGPYLSQIGYWFWGISAALGFFASIVIHELGHALAARLQGIHPSRITLLVFGGVVEFDEPPPSPGIELLVAIAGPAVSGALALSCWLLAGLAGWSYDLTILLNLMAWTNGTLLIFNLLPALPLDGGFILHSLFWNFAGDPSRANRWSQRAGAIVAAALLVTGACYISVGQTTLGICFCLGGLWLGFVEKFLKSSGEDAYERTSNSVRPKKSRTKSASSHPRLSSRLDANASIHNAAPLSRR